MLVEDLTPDMVIVHKRFGRKLQFRGKLFGNTYLFSSVGESCPRADFLSRKDLLNYEEYLPSLENK